MRAITYDRFGPAAEVLTLADLPTPDPAPGEVLLRVERSGVNPSDVKVRAGSRPGVTRPPFPQIVPHSDGAGVIEAVGDGVDPARVGQRAWTWNAQWQRAFGTAAEYITLPAAQAVPLPEAVSFDVGATLGIPGLTATHSVLGGGEVDGQTVLVSGGAGTVGHIAIQVARASGARVLATARGAGLEAAREAGAEAVFDYTDPELAAKILEETGGQGVDRIVEVEFGENVRLCTDVIATRGTIAAYGSARTMSPVVPFYEMMFKAVTLDMVLVYLLSQPQRDRAIANLTDLLTRGALDIRIAEVLALEDCAKAHDIVANGARAGAILLRCPADG
ncbi:NADPH:quinone reductase [Mesobacterium pallidum]|uniref:NADPH:quinone reductase n=1 Tax=Mesobacterium pallidum TaxID=2872037 RepID=UPI001EE18082|nr:NADPH:quinone reductase [Mesobacterium pallidum]